VNASARLEGQLIARGVFSTAVGGCALALAPYTAMIVLCVALVIDALVVTWRAIGDSTLARRDRVLFAADALLDLVLVALVLILLRGTPEIAVVALLLIATGLGEIAGAILVPKKPELTLIVPVVGIIVFTAGAFFFDATSFTVLGVAAALGAYAVLICALALTAGIAFVRGLRLTRRHDER
jgi:hypothetical protein